MTEAHVIFESVSRRFGNVTAVDGVSFAVQRGELVTLLGPSGCGKTTVLRMVAGLEAASDGRILIAGQDVTRLPTTERDVSMVFQSYALFPHMTVLQNVAYGLEAGKLSRDDVLRRARIGLEQVGLGGYEQRYPSALSGGQQQRVAVARALVIEPAVLLFDEPLSNLDAKLRRQMRDEIRDLQSRLGLTTIYVTHDQEEALAVSDRIIVMRQGRIAQIGSPRELYAAPRDRFVADFIGGANLIDCEVVAIEGEETVVGIGEVLLRLRGADMPPGPACLVVRPQTLMLDEPGIVRGQVMRATWLGSHVELRTATRWGELTVTLDDQEEVPAAGSTVGLILAARGLALVPR
jgi:iron(III) transport system ATP-binding protein